MFTKVFTLMIVLPVAAVMAVTIVRFLVYVASGIEAGL